MKTILLCAVLLLPTALLAQSREASIGCWTMPARAGEFIQLGRDGNFYFNDYNTASGEFEYLRGTWSYTSKGISLLYDDRPKQSFTFRKDKSGKIILTKAGGFLFRKAAPKDCVIEEN